MGRLGSFRLPRSSVDQNYDAQGDYHNTVTSTLTGTTDSEYDVNGNLIAVTATGRTVNYAYDLATGNKTEVWTTNTDIHYAYDQAGELTTVTVNRNGDAASLTGNWRM